LFNIKESKIINKEYATLIELEKVGLPGAHNLYNLLGAASGAHCLGISDAKISEVMNSFNGIPHRLELVDTINNVEYINDSKATNIDAVKVALESYSRPIVLILGGLAKGNDFAEIIKYKEHIKSIIAYGDARQMISNELSNDFDVAEIESLEESVKISKNIANSGDIVLLSPGCASFDQFNNFEDRGEKFTKWVKNL
jgi:UDP-N-acetylmuramoylalanine--D-glutamate ligase